MKRNKSYLLALLIIELAFFLRFYRLPYVPYGWHPDEATKGLLAQDVLAGRSHPVFFSAFTGRESLYIYLEAGMMLIVGKGMLAGRLLSAAIGVLTVAETFALGKQWFGRRVGLLASGFMASSLWHLIASRNAYRAVIQPLIQIPALWFLYRGWRSGRKRDFIAAGFFVGLSQYTYTAARAFPLLVGAFIVLAFACGGQKQSASRKYGAALALGVALLTFAPLGWHFYHHPIDFYGRAEQISVFSPQWSGGDPWGRLQRSLQETAGMFTQRGDPNFRFNLAGQPVFGLPDGTLFYIGIVLCIVLAFKRRGLQRLTHLTLLVWLMVMLLPMALSAEGLPYYQRAIGILPAVYYFPALSIDAVLDLLRQRRRLAIHPAWLSRLAWALVVLLFAWLIVRSYHQYFDEWHNNPRNDDDRRVAMVYVANYLKARRPSGQLYISTEYPQHPTLAFLAPEQYDAAHLFDARQSLPLPSPDSEATYVFLLETPPNEALLARASGLRKVETELDRFGRPVFDVYQWLGGNWPVPTDVSPATWSWEVHFEPGDPEGLRHSIDLPVNFGDTLAFMGHDRSAQSVAPGETLEVILYWRLLKRPDRHYSIFVHVLDVDSNIVGEYDANRYPTFSWREDGSELLLDYFPLQIRPDIPPGEYQVEIGVYNQPTGERLPILVDGEMVADRLLLRPLVVR